MGAAVLVRHPDRPPFTGDDLLVASQLATHTALGMNKAVLYGREVSVADALQRTMLARWATTRRSCPGCCTPARETGRPWTVPGQPALPALGCDPAEHRQAGVVRTAAAPGPPDGDPGGLRACFHRCPHRRKISSRDGAGRSGGGRTSGRR